MGVRSTYSWTSAMEKGAPLLRSHNALGKPVAKCCRPSIVDGAAEGLLDDDITPDVGSPLGEWRRYYRTERPEACTDLSLGTLTRVWREMEGSAPTLAPRRQPLDPMLLQIAKARRLHEPNASVARVRQKREQARADAEAAARGV